MNKASEDKSREYVILIPRVTVLLIQMSAWLPSLLLLALPFVTPPQIIQLTRVI